MLFLSSGSFEESSRVIFTVKDGASDSLLIRLLFKLFVSKALGVTN
jgi:hypothetical protein